MGSSPVLDVTGRALALRPVDLDSFFRPASVAVVGASDTEGRPTTINWRLLKGWAERVAARFHPVNPRRATVDGIACVPRLQDVTDNIDVVAVLLADPFAAVADAVDIGAGFVVVFSAGFAELGSAGAAAQQRLASLVAGTKTRLLGPNTNLNAFERFRDDLDGPAIALLSQSGHQGRPLFMLQENGVRVSHWAPTGNEADLELADFAAWFAHQPEIGAIAAYVEGFRDGRTLGLAADECMQAGVPLVTVKVGRSEAGQAAAASHTGKLTGADRLTDAVFRQFGVIRVDTLDALGDTATLLARAPAPRSDGVAVYSISGGTNSHLADLCEAAGLRLPTFSAKTQARLHQWIPDYLKVSNPIDCGGHPVGDERGRQILDTLVAEPDVGLLICAIAGPFPPLSDRLAADLVAVAETAQIPVCVIWGSPVGTEPAWRDVLLSSRRLIGFRSAGNCVEAARSYFAWHRTHQRYRSPFHHAARRRSAAATQARAVLGERGRPGLQSEWTAKRLLDAYGIPVGREYLVGSAAEAVQAAAHLGGPVVLKACAADLAHKSELGLVQLGVEGPRAVRAAYRELVERAAAQLPGGSDGLDGIIVAEQVYGGVEAVVGVSHDELFGPAVMVGLGGVLIEVLGDVTFRVPPFGRAEARRMLTELRGAALLAGVRGRPPADVDALVDVIMKVQRLAVDLDDELLELDVNPLVVRARGEGVVALDAMARSRPAASSAPSTRR